MVTYQNLLDNEMFPRIALKHLMKSGESTQNWGNHFYDAGFVLLRDYSEEAIPLERLTKPGLTLESIASKPKQTATH